MTDYPLVKRESSEYYGDTALPLRVWIADNVGQIRHYHVQGLRSARMTNGMSGTTTGAATSTTC